MKTKFLLKTASVFTASSLLLMGLTSFVFAVVSPQVQTNAATNIQNNSATLNGNLYNMGGYSTVNVWFQWGTDTNYSDSTNFVTQSYTGSFSQQVNSLASNQTFHYRAVAQGVNGSIVYGQDMTFNSTDNGNYQGNSGQLDIDKMVMNLSSGNMNWYDYANASPLDILKFAVIIQVIGNQPVYNIVVKDVLPLGLNNYDRLTVNGVASYDNINQGVSVGTLQPGQSATITYQVQVAPHYNQATLVNTAFVSSSNNTTNNSSATVYVTGTGMFGATSVPTGFMSNFFKDYFILPLVIIIFEIWLLASGAIYTFADWLKEKLQKARID